MQLTPRPSWEEYFFSLTNLVATRSTCPRLSVGAVLVKNKRVIGMGYNGAPDGEPHCIDEGCLMVDDHCVRTIHGEMNALINCLGNPYGGTMYINYESCSLCQAKLKAAGVTDIRWMEPYGS